MKVSYVSRKEKNEKERYVGFKKKWNLVRGEGNGSAEERERGRGERHAS